MANMIVKIVQTNLLAHLDLTAFSYTKDADHGEMILEALCSSNINLEHLYLSANRVWWESEECLQLLQAFLR